MRALKQFRLCYNPIFLICFLAFFISAFNTIQAQNATSLERISWSERSDGEGYVVRLHMSSAPEDFRIWQTSAEHTQLAVFQENIDIQEVNLPDASPPFKSFEISTIPDGIGVDIHLEPDVYVLADVYLDANGKDVLVNLEDSYDFEVEVLTDGISPVEWNQVAEGDTAPDDTEVDTVQRGQAIEDDVIQEFEAFQQDGLDLNTVVIDAGHGGRDPGATGPGGTREKDVALSVAKKLGGYIEEHLPEINVVYTREDDSFVGLEERGSIANEAEGDLFISLHANASSNRRAQGTEVYFLGQAKTEEALEVMKRENRVVRFEDEDERSEELSEQQLLIYELTNSGYLASSEVFSGKIDRQFSERARRISRGVKQAPFIVLYHASMPAVLVEMGFISNPQEEQFLKSEYGQAIIASAIFRSVRAYRNRIQGNQRSDSSP